MSDLPANPVNPANPVILPDQPDLPDLPDQPDLPVILPDFNGTFEPSVEQIKAVFDNLIISEPAINNEIFTAHLGRNDTVPYIVYSLQQQTKQITTQEATIQLLTNSMANLIKQVNIMTNKK